MDHHPPPFFNRGPSARLRLAVYALSALVLMIADARFNALAAVRDALSVVLYPLQRAAHSPVELAQRAGEFFVTQAKLTGENGELRLQNLWLMAQLQRFDALRAENAQLRQLLGTRQQLELVPQLAEVIHAFPASAGRKILLNKGDRQKIEPGQAVIDASGVVGQVTRVLPFSSEVSLLTDKSQTIPVESLRNGLRAVLYGMGPAGYVELRYMPMNVDIQTGDRLVTSGIDGTYPAGLPVAVVSRVERNSDYAFARIRCTPTAGIDRHRHLLVLPLPEDAVAPPVPETPLFELMPSLRLGLAEPLLPASLTP